MKRIIFMSFITHLLVISPCCFHPDVTMHLSSSDASFIGENSGDLAGYSVSSAGDVNGDGYDDILIGAEYNNDGGAWAGKAYLLYGPLNGTMDLYYSDASFIGENRYDYAGHSVSSAGDVNNDGYDDILIGAPGNDDGGYNAGKAYLLYGPLKGTIHLYYSDASFIGQCKEDCAGISVSSAGDVNGDGYDDILIGAYYNDYGGDRAGKAYLLYGPLKETIDLSHSNASFFGENSGDYAGWSVSSAGDVNNDGYDDILIGAYYNDNGGSEAGKAYLFYGPLKRRKNLSSSNASFIGENSWDLAGYSVSSAGDVNNDGYYDILIGAHGNDDGGYWAGKAYLFYGPLNGTKDLSSSDASFIGETGDCAGVSISSAGDVNNDGYDDILIGAHCNDDSGSFAGKVYLLYGPLNGTIDLSSSDASFIGENSDDWAGYSVSSAGDVNNDGYDDILIGAPYNDDGGFNAGKAYLIYGGW